MAAIIISKYYLCYALLYILLWIKDNINEHVLVWGNKDWSIFSNKYMRKMEKPSLDTLNTVFFQFTEKS